MSRSAEFVLGDGVICSCPFTGDETRMRDSVCLIEVDGVSEFGRYLRSYACSGACHAGTSGTLIRLADGDDLAKLAGNVEATTRARVMLLKWVADNRRQVQTLRMRFSVRRERLSIVLYVGEFINFQPILEVLEKRFQTKVSVKSVSPREISGAIGGVGVCGCVLCCSNGVCEKTAVDMKMARQQSIPLHDSAATGVCGKLKCCVGYELDQSSASGNPHVQ